MSDKYSNGLQWENLTLKVIDLVCTLSEVTGVLPGAWRPVPPSAGPTRETSDAWQQIEGGYRDRIHEAARALIKTARVPDPTPEIIYFLGLRLQAALNHVEAMCVVKDERPVSLWAFPALTPDEVIEWLLTDWADDHAIMIAFPEMDAPSSQRTSDSSHLTPSF
ncbi:MAG TPA: hypothetical protein VK968_18060 [Roseimicrobium sp.]|nr:hypothetical protein [Roseimicrobium sp.]